MEDNPYSPEKLITSYRTANGILEVFQGNLYRHTVTDPLVSASKDRPKTLTLLDEEFSTNGK